MLEIYENILLLNSHFICSIGKEAVSCLKVVFQVLSKSRSAAFLAYDIKTSRLISKNEITLGSDNTALPNAQ
jgi:hypothetical protein